MSISSIEHIAHAGWVLHEHETWFSFLQLYRWRWWNKINIFLISLSSSRSSTLYNSSALHHIYVRLSPLFCGTNAWAFHIRVRIWTHWNIMLKKAAIDCSCLRKYRELLPPIHRACIESNSEILFILRWCRCICSTWFLSRHHKHAQKMMEFKVHRFKDTIIFQLFWWILKKALRLGIWQYYSTQFYV